MQRGVWTALGILTVLCGCAGEPFDYVKVSGTVKYEDGTTIPGETVQVLFVPLRPPADSATFPRTGVGVVGKDGSFDTVTSLVYGDGVVAGEHKVVVQSLTEQQTPTGAAPDLYTRPDTTPLRVNTADSPFEIKIPKPEGAPAL